MKNGVATVVFIVGVILLGQTSLTTFVPGAEKGAYSFLVLVFLVPIFLSQRMVLRVTSLVFCVVCVAGIIQDHKRGLEYEEFIQHRDSVISPFGGNTIRVLTTKRPNSHQYCFDYTGIIPDEVVEQMEIHSREYKKFLGIDLVTVVIPSLKGNDVLEIATDLFSHWEIGKDTLGKKGVLILIALKEEKIKIEVGYDLEAIYTDQYISQIEREMLIEFLEQADWERGFLATIEMFGERAYHQERKGESVRDITGGDADVGYYSEGAGAKGTFDFGATVNKPKPATSEELKKYFSAQPTPAEAFERYMEFNTWNMSDYTLDLFTEESKEFFSHWRTSSGQRRSEAEVMNGLAYIVREKGSYAVVMAPKSNDIEGFIRHCPHFFRRVDKGWQIDINAMGRSLIMAGPTWHFLSYKNPYMFAFKDYMLRMNRYYPDEGQTAFLGLTYAGNRKGSRGFIVSPERNSPAEEAGIEEGDELISIDGVAITQAYQDWQMMKGYHPGDRVEVVVFRGGREKKIQVTLSEPVSTLDKFPYKKKDGDPWLGMYVGYSQPYERKVMESYDCVLEVIEGGPADQAGIKSGDCFDFEVNRDQLFSESLRPGDQLYLRVLRDLKDIKEVILTVGSYSPGKKGI